MGTKNDPGEFDGYGRALPDEPMFTLLGRDPSAPELIEEWANARMVAINAGELPQSDVSKVTEARKCAADMRAWREANDGAWRTPGPVA